MSRNTGCFRECQFPLGKKKPDSEANENLVVVICIYKVVGNVSNECIWISVLLDEMYK